MKTSSVFVAVAAIAAAMLLATSPPSEALDFTGVSLPSVAISAPSAVIGKLG